MKVKFTLLIFLLFLCVMHGYAQIKYGGKISDAKGEPLPGVSVKVVGTQTGTVTNVDGVFSITASEGNEILVSSIGFEKSTIKLSKSTNLTITLKAQENALNEVVVIGYGTQKKSDLTGSVASVTSKDFTQGPNSNALQLLNGKAPGVTISQSSSAPGAGTKIQVRGAGSINSSNGALIVIDGLPGLSARDISPDDIESIEVLKDASAATIYGTRAANGVVLITTKKGKKGEPALKYSVSYGLQSVAKKLDVLNGQQYMETLNAIRVEGGQDALFTPDQINTVGAGTNWQNQIFNTSAPVQNHALSISGGADKSDYYAGVNFFNQQGLVKTSAFKKINIRTNLNFQPKEYLRFKLNANFTRDIQNSIIQPAGGVNENAGPINSSIQFDPTLPIGTDPLTGRYYQNPAISLDNPLALINGINDDNLGSNFYGTFTTEFEPLKDLVATARLGGTIASGQASSYRNRSTLNGLASGGIGSRSSSDYSQWLAEFLINYKKRFGEKHDLSILAGATFEEFLTQSVSASSIGFLSDVTGADLLQSGNNDIGDNVASSKDRNRLNGVLGRINYGFLDKYLLTASFRYDGTSRFSDENKFAFFPAAAIAWKISKEPFFSKALPIFGEVKLRASYGQLGNQGIGNYQTLQTLVAGGSAVFGNSIFQGVVPARLPNANLKWETTEETDFGIDFSLLKNRISGSVDYYIRNTKDQLFSKPLPSVVGFSSVFVNAGNVENKGWDFLLNTVNVDKENFKWETGFNMALLKNKVVSLPDFIPQIISGSVGTFINNYLIVQEGSPLQSFYGYETQGIFQSAGEVSGSAQPTAKPGQIRFKDQNGDNKIDATDRVVLGSPFPSLTMGLNNRLRYKNFSLELFFQWVNDVQTLDGNITESIYPTNEFRNRLSKYYVNRWTVQNPNNTYPSGVNPSAYGGAFSVNSLTVQDASFIRFKTANLSYNIPMKKNKFISGIQVYAVGDNIFTFTNYEGYDPDASATGTDAVARVSYNSYPLNRTFRLGVNVNF